MTTISWEIVCGSEGLKNISKAEYKKKRQRKGKAKGELGKRKKGKISPIVTLMK